MGPEVYGGVEAVRSDEQRSRTLGRGVLVELAKSSLATAEERGLAKRLLADATRYDPGGSDLRLILPGSQLDAIQFVEDDWGEWDGWR